MNVCAKTILELMDNQDFILAASSDRLLKVCGAFYADLIKYNKGFIDSLFKCLDSIFDEHCSINLFILLELFEVNKVVKQLVSTNNMNMVKA